MTGRPRYEVASIDDLERVDVAGVHWRPVRRRFGITGFGTNAYSADCDEALIEPHDEAGPSGAGGHEELYVVLRGHARFILDGEEVDAPAGTLVFCGEPAVRRSAVALRDGTVALAIGGRAGAALPVSPWEHYFYAWSAAESGDPVGAYETAAGALADHPDNPSVHFNLACLAARAGESELALRHLVRATELDPGMREAAASDPDLDPIRGLPGFPGA